MEKALSDLLERPKPRRLLGYEELKTVKGIRWTRMHIDRLEREDAFPRRVHLSPGTVGWFEHEIDAWIDQRAAERDRD